jgi:hypothetical protein
MYFSPPPPPSLIFPLVPLLVFVGLLVLLAFARQVSRLTRAGLWLLLWLPLCIAAVFTWAYVDRSTLLYHCWGPVPLGERAFQIISSFSLLAFACGLLFLLVAGVRRLIRWHHAKA